jgi:hypothetical protein
MLPHNSKTPPSANKMTESDFFLNRFENRHCEFLFKDGSKVTGVISTFIFEKTNSLFLIETINMSDFQIYKDHNDIENMKRLSKAVILENIQSVKFLNKIP